MIINTALNQKMACTDWQRKYFSLKMELQQTNAQRTYCSSDDTTEPMFKHGHSNTNNQKAETNYFWKKKKNKQSILLQDHCNNCMLSSNMKINNMKLTINSKYILHNENKEKKLDCNHMLRTNKCKELITTPQSCGLLEKLIVQHYLTSIEGATASSSHRN